MNGELEAIRENYRPKDGVKVFLLGESPPPGRGFFYTGHSTLFTYTVPVLVKECGLPKEPGAS